MEIKVKIKMINIKADNSSATKHRYQRLNMNAMLIIKYPSTAMQGKRNLCECHTRFFFILYHKFINISEFSTKS